MSTVSNVFGLLFDKEDPRKRRPAIVIFKSPDGRDFEGRDLRKAANRVQYLQSRAGKVQGAFQQVVDGYLSSREATTLKESGPVRHRLAGGGLLPVATVDVTRDTLEALGRQPNVLAVLPNQRVRLLGPDDVSEGEPTPKEKTQGFTWGMQELGIGEFWAAAKTKGKGIKIGVLDTGVYGDHPALKGRVEHFTILDPAGRGIPTKDNRSFDYQRHGTHVCGTIVGGTTSHGVAIGVAPDAKLAVAQIHFGERSFLSTVVDGIEWAIEKGVDIINLSIGIEYYDDDIDVLFEILVRDGVAPVIAIGNCYYGSTCCPGNAPHALGVGAIGKRDDETTSVANFSGGGSLDLPGTAHPRVVKPDLVAPGVSVLSCVPPINATGKDGVGEEYRIMDGSSMAAPHVAGVIAILMSARPDVDVGRIFEAVKDTADHPGGRDNRPDNRWGYGLINPAKALEALPPRRTRKRSH